MNAVEKFQKESEMRKRVNENLRAEYEALRDENEKLRDENACLRAQVDALKKELHCRRSMEEFGYEAGWESS